jgi:multidrug resistance efflux pump
MLARAMLAILCAAPLHASAVVFSGEVQSVEAQSIFTPPSDSAPVVLRYYVADGTLVKPGDVVLRIDAGQKAAEIRKLDAEAEQAAAKIAKEVGELRLKAADAELASIDAQAALDTARVDAAIPGQLISALDFDNHQAELARSEHDAALKQQQLADARAAATRRADDGKLELDKMQVQRAFDQAQVGAAEVRAERAGVVMHGFNNHLSSSGRFDEGASSFPGQKVGEIVGTGAMQVRAWVLEPERAGIAPGAKLRLAFDALPGREVAGTIQTISGASEAKPEWGAGRYFVVDIDLADATGLPLKPGMSVRVETAGGQTDQPGETAGAGIAHDVVRASGEIFARSTVAISPPEVEDLWQMTITQMATDGQVVKKGDPIVTFDGGEVAKQLTAKKSELEEKLRQQEKLRLELSEKARTGALTTVEAEADMTKAQRKASQPEAYVPGVEYKKLIIARRKTEQHRALSIERERIAGEERLAEQRAADAEVARLRSDVARLQVSMDALSITAPCDGILLHGVTPWDGEKIDTGKQIWRGQSVADIPDLTTLAVRASLAERDLTRVKVGDVVRIIIEGGSGQTLSGHVDDIGIGVHSKSRVEPVPVVDLRILLDANAIALKPGQSVRVEIAPNAAKDART